MIEYLSNFVWLSISLLWLVILPAPLNCEKITFLFTLKMAIPQQKALCVLEFTKTNVTVTVQRAFKAKFGIDRPHPESIFDGGLDSLKRVDGCANERVLEYHVFQRSK